MLTIPAQNRLRNMNMALLQLLLSAIPAPINLVWNRWSQF